MRKSEFVMNKREWKVKVLMAGMAIFLTGCGSDFPDMTQEEEQMVGEYAANILLKYDANHRSRLVSREIVAEEDAKKEEKDDIVQQEPSQAMDPVEDTPVIEIGQRPSDNVDAGSLEAFYELPEGVTITYQGHDVVGSYCQDGEDSDFFALDASEGKQLLVIKFKIENQSQAEQTIDLLSQPAMIRATVNGTKKYNILTTMLINDMATYKGVIPANGVSDVVLLAEIDSELSEDITALSIQFKNEVKSHIIQLK